MVKFLLTSRIPETRHRMGGTRFRVLTRGFVNGEWEEVAIQRLDKDS